MISHFQIRLPPDIHTEYSDSQLPPCEDYLYCDPDYPLETYAHDFFKSGHGI